MLDIDHGHCAEEAKKAILVLFGYKPLFLIGLGREMRKGDFESFEIFGKHLCFMLHECHACHERVILQEFFFSKKNGRRMKMSLSIFFLFFSVISDRFCSFLFFSVLFLPTNASNHDNEKEMLKIHCIFISGFRRLTLKISPSQTPKTKISSSLETRH